MNFDNKQFAISEMIFSLFLSISSTISGRFNFTSLFAYSITVALIIYGTFKSNKENYNDWKSNNIHSQLKYSIYYLLICGISAIIFRITYVLTMMIPSTDYLTFIITSKFAYFIFSFSTYNFLMIGISSILLVFIRYLDDLADKDNNNER